MREDEKRRQRKKIIPIVVVLSLVVVLCVLSTIQDVLVLAAWDSGGVLTYKGDYICSVKSSGKSQHYIFELGNGDQVSIKKSAQFADLQNALDDETPPALVFQYSKYPNLFWISPKGNVHALISVASAADGVEYISNQEMKKEMRRNCIIFLPAGIFLFCVDILLLHHMIKCPEKVKITRSV